MRVIDDGLVGAIGDVLAITIRMNRKIRWDFLKEPILGDAPPTQMLERPTRKPWRL